MRVLHGALRTIIDLCVTYGYQWRREFALALDAAAELAADQKHHLPEDAFVAAWLESQWLATAILAHTVKREHVA